jgi:hypothetical protein
LLAEINSELEKTEAFVESNNLGFDVCEWKVATFTAFPPKILLRACYREMINLIEKAAEEHNSNTYIEILGSPGMGKSVFGYYLFWTFKKQLEKIQGNLAFLYYYHPNIGCFVCGLFNGTWMCLDVNHHDLIDLCKYEEVSQVSPFYIIIDGCRKKIVLPPNLEAVLVLIGSPKVFSDTSNLEKRHDISHQRMYYPLWGEQEFENFKQIFGLTDSFDQLQDNILKDYNLSTLKKSDVFGRCPRYIYEVGENNFLKVLDGIRDPHVRSCLQSFKTENLQQFLSYNDVVHRIFFIESLDYYRYKIIFASAYLKALVDRYYEGLEEINFLEDYQRSLNSKNSVLIGIQFETLFHFRFGKLGFSQLTICPFPETNYYPEEKLSFTVSECVRTDNINASIFKDNVYYRPIKFNFATFDSVFVGDVKFGTYLKKKCALFFQVTINKSHDVKSSNFKIIEDTLKNKVYNVLFIFVSTKSNKGLFKIPQIKTKFNYFFSIFDP